MKKLACGVINVDRKVEAIRVHSEEGDAIGDDEIQHQSEASLLSVFCPRARSGYLIDDLPQGHCYGLKPH